MKVVAFLFFFLLFAFALSLALMGCRPARDSFTLDGEVVETGSRLRPYGNGSVQEFALSLKPLRLPSNLQLQPGQELVVVECYSTRCAVLRPGNRARFTCELSPWKESLNVPICNFNGFL